MNLCKDCKLQGRDELGLGPYCYSPKNIKHGYRELGTKPPVAQLRVDHCTDQRWQPWPFNWVLCLCGRSGRWFEPKNEKGQ